MLWHFTYLQAGYRHVIEGLYTCCNSSKSVNSYNFQRTVFVLTNPQIPKGLVSVGNSLLNPKFLVKSPMFAASRSHFGWWKLSELPKFCCLCGLRFGASGARRPVALDQWCHPEAFARQELNADRVKAPEKGTSRYPKIAG